MSTAATHDQPDARGASTPVVTIRDAGDPFNDSDADLIVRSSDNVDFKVYRAILFKSSPTLRAIITDNARLLFPEWEDRDNVQVIRIGESQSTLALLLGIIYPGDAPVFDSVTLSQLVALLRALDRYIGLASIPRTIHSIMDKIAKEKPHLAFSLARRYNLPRDIVEKAVIETLRFSPLNPIQRVRDEHLSEYLTSGQFDELARYHRESVHAASTVIRSFLPESTSLRYIDFPGAVLGAIRQGQSHPGCVYVCRCDRQVMVQQHSRRPQSFHIPRWVIDYFIRCGGILNEKPHWSSLANDWLSTHPVRALTSCRGCEWRIQIEAPKFQQLLADNIESKIKEVRALSSLGGNSFTDSHLFFGDGTQTVTVPL